MSLPEPVALGNEQEQLFTIEVGENVPVGKVHFQMVLGPPEQGEANPTGEARVGYWAPSGEDWDYDIVSGGMDEQGYQVQRFTFRGGQGSAEGSVAAGTWRIGGWWEVMDGDVPNPPRVVSFALVIESST